MGWIWLACGAHSERDATTRLSRLRSTAIFYLNHQWQAADGGELLVYPPAALDESAASAAESAAAVARVAPRGNRLLLFYADARVPHEVRPSHAERFAVTLWYYDNAEVARVAPAAVR